MANNKKKYSLVLLSGGIDSTACLNFYISHNYKVEALFINYGQLSKINEQAAVKNVCKYYKIPFQEIKIIGFKKKFFGKILGRNAFLLNIGLMDFKEKKGILALGIHAGTNYEDCSEEFIKNMQNIFDIYSGGTIQIGTPFLKMYKKDILQYCRDNNVPLLKTYSCELGHNQPCGKCLSCNELKLLNV